MDLGFEKDGDSTLMFTLTPPQTKDAGIEVSPGCYCFVIDVSGRWASTSSFARLAPVASWAAIGTLPAHCCQNRHPCHALPSPHHVCGLAQHERAS